MFWIMGGDALFPALFALSGIPFLTETMSHQLDHSAWNGFTFYDLIFPLFPFIVGLTMPFSFGKRKERGDSKKVLMKHVATRTLLLIIFGLIYGGLFNLDFVPPALPGSFAANSGFHISLFPSFIYILRNREHYISGQYQSSLPTGPSSH